MPYAVAATWLVKPGHEQDIAEILERMTPLSRTEPGCRHYQAHRSVEDSRTFFLYEVYDDEAAFEAHVSTPHFEQYVRNGAIPILEVRERVYYETLEF